MRSDRVIDRLYDAGKITDKHEDKDFFTRLVHVHKEFPGKGKAVICMSMKAILFSITPTT